MRDNEAAAQLFLASLALIERILDAVCRCCRFSAEDAEEFRGRAKVHLIKDDYRILRCFEGRATLAGYLRVVFAKLALDYRNETQGKWRPSATAKKLGKTAILLDQRLHRDKDSLEDALRHVAMATGESRETLEALAAKLPVNLGRPKNAGPELLDDLPSAVADDPVETRERRERAQHVIGALQKALAAFSDEDRLLLKLFYWKGVGARDLVSFFPHSNERIIYRQLESARERLKTLLVAGGVSPAMIAELLSWKDLDAEIHWGED